MVQYIHITLYCWLGKPVFVKQQFTNVGNFSFQGYAALNVDILQLLSSPQRWQLQCLPKHWTTNNI
jgi:hypothetical protein